MANATIKMLDMDGARELLEQVKEKTGGGGGQNDLGLYIDSDGDICQED